VGDIKSLSLPQVLAVLEHAWAHSPRNGLMFTLAFRHGLRASEVVGLTASSFDVQGDDVFLTVARLKGSSVTTQQLYRHENPLLDEKQAVLDFIRGMHANQRLFPIGRKQCWRLFRRYARAAGIARDLQHPHVLKHSIAMEVTPTQGIHVTKQLLGHKRISSTQVYLQTTDRKAAEAAARALSGVLNS